MIAIKGSSTISAVEYNEYRNTLEVLFHKGSTYMYKKVPLKVYNELMKSDSIGKYFCANIQKSYEYEKLNK